MRKSRDLLESVSLFDIRTRRALINDLNDLREEYALVEAHYSVEIICREMNSRNCDDDDVRVLLGATNETVQMGAASYEIILRDILRGEYGQGLRGVVLELARRELMRGIIYVVHLGEFGIRFDQMNAYFDKNPSAQDVYITATIEAVCEFFRLV